MVIQTQEIDAMIPLVESLRWHAVWVTDLDGDTHHVMIKGTMTPEEDATRLVGVHMDDNRDWWVNLIDVTEIHVA